GPAPAASGQESRRAPARIAIAPEKIRRSTFSRNTTHAIVIVARPSVLSKRAPAEAGNERQARHEQGRAENAAEEHDCAKPAEVAYAQRHLGAPETKRTTSRCDQCGDRHPSQDKASRQAAADR